MLQELLPAVPPCSPGDTQRSPSAAVGVGGVPAHREAGGLCGEQLCPRASQRVQIELQAPERGETAAPDVQHRCLCASPPGAGDAQTWEELKLCLFSELKTPIGKKKKKEKSLKGNLFLASFFLTLEGAASTWKAPSRGGMEGESSIFCVLNASQNFERKLICFGQVLKEAVKKVCVGISELEQQMKQG